MMRVNTTLLRSFSLLLTLLVGCERAAESRAQVAPKAPAQDAPAQVAALRLSSKISFPAAPVVMAFGDVHGDLSALRKVLRLAGAIDASDSWVGGKLVVVHTGDSIDRGDQDREVLDLLHKLREQAERAGGALIALSGNHELMNVAQDFRYVTPASFGEFVGEGGRNAAFSPGGPYARMLLERPIFVRVGDSVFVHGGILEKHLRYGLDRMNDEVHAWLRGDQAAPPAVVMAEDGPVWTRAYSNSAGPAECDELSRVLSQLGAKRMVVGHTPQREGISNACNGQVYRIDVGMSQAYGGPIQVLELRGDQLNVRRAGA
jgi:hypothetical protein